MWYHKHKRKRRKTSPYFRHWFDKNPVFNFTPYIKIVSIYRPDDYIWRGNIDELRRSRTIDGKYYLYFRKWIEHNKAMVSKIFFPKKSYIWLQRNGYKSFYRWIWNNNKRRRNYKHKSWQNSISHKKKYIKRSILKTNVKKSKFLNKNELLKTKLKKFFNKNNIFFFDKYLSFKNNKHLNNVKKNKYLNQFKYNKYLNRFKKFKKFKKFKNSSEIYDPKVFSILKWLFNKILKSLTQKKKHNKMIKKDFYFDLSNFSKKMLFLSNIDNNNIFSKLSMNHQYSLRKNRKKYKFFEFAKLYYTNKRFNKYLQSNKFNNNIILNTFSKIFFLKNLLFKKSSIYQSHIYQMKYNYVKEQTKVRYLPFNLFIVKRVIKVLNIKLNKLYLIKQFNDSFNLIYKFIYWYSSKTFYKYVSIFNIFYQKTKYDSYKESYVYNFNKNYIYVQSILKCYKTLNIKDEFLKYRNKTKKHFIFFINRISKLSNFNYYYKRYATKFKIHTIEKSLFLKYNFNINKKLNKLKRLFLTSKKKYYNNTSVSDISFLYYDKIDNVNYTDHLDDKYNFFIKKILHKKILNNLNKNNYLNKKKSIYWKKNRGNIFTISPSINNNKYNYIYKFLNIYHQVSNSYKNNYFYSLNTIKLNIFILKSNLFTFFKDIFICKYKFYIYKKYFKRKAFIKKNLLWFEHRFVFDENNYLVTRYDYNKKLCLDLLYDIKYFFKNSYIDWFYYFNGNTCLKKRKSFFYSYKKSYNKFYKKKLFKIKLVKYYKYLIQKRLLKNKETLIESFKEGLLEDNPYFDTDLNEKEINRWIFVYNRYFKIMFFKECLLSPNILNLKKNYSFLKNNNSNKLNKNKIKNNNSNKVNKNKIKNNNSYLQKYLNDYCSKLIKSNDLDNYYNTQYFQLHNKFLLYKKQIYNKSNLFIQKFWNFNLNNKKINISFIIDTIHSLHKLKKLKSIKSYNMLILKYSTLKYFSLRDKYFNNLWLFNKRYNNNKVKKKSTSFFNNNYNHLKYKHKLFSYFFNLRSFSKIYLLFFLKLKELIFGNHLKKSFSIYKNKMLIYDLNKDDFKHKLTLIHMPNIFNFFDMEFSELLTNTNI